METKMMNKQLKAQKRQESLLSWKKDFRLNWSLYVMMIPVILFYVLFCYRPMYGVLMAFQRFSPALGVAGSPWIGFDNFKDFFLNPDFFKLLRNTLTISITSLVFGFPAPIILALLLNELRQQRFKAVTQSVLYFPNFISAVVICGMIKTFTADTGILSQLVAIFTGERVNLLHKPELFVPIYVFSSIWQTVGWSSIIYIAALSMVDQELYEAARLDGANRWKQTLHVTIPSIIPTIVINLILNVGHLMSVGSERIILLYNPLIYDTADVISSYTYRIGFVSQDWSYSTAIGLFNSVINLILVITTNTISRKLNDTSLW